MVHGTFLPGVGINVFVVFFMESDLVMPMWTARRGNNSGIMPAVREHKCHIGVSQHLNFINRTPRRDVICEGTDRKNGNPNIAQRNWPSTDFVATFGQIIVQEEITEVLRVHAVMRVASEFHAMRSIIGWRSPIKYECTTVDQIRSFERNSWNAPAICLVSRKPCSAIMCSRKLTWASSMNRVSSPASVKSVWAASRVRLFSRSSPSRAIAAATVESRVPPRQ